MAAEPSPTSYALLKDFQNVFGTLVGFGGVCLTLWYNARIARFNRSDELARERAATRAMLLGELRRILVVLVQTEKVVDSLNQPDEVALPRKFNSQTHSRAYEAALPRIGLLTESETDRVVTAYSRCESLSAMLADMHSLFDVANPDDVMRLEFRAFNNLLKSTIGDVQGAIDAISASSATKALE